MLGVCVEVGTASPSGQHECTQQNEKLVLLADHTWFFENSNQRYL